MRRPLDPPGQAAEHVHGDRDVASLARIVGVVAGGGLERGRRVLDRAGHRPGVVDALVRAEADPEVGDQAEGGLETDDSAEGGGDPDRAALVAAEGDVDLARRYGRAGSRRRAAGHVLGVVGVERPTVVADAAAGPVTAAEAVHDVLSDDRAARLEHAGHDGGVEVRDEAFEGEGAEAHRHAGDRDVVLVSSPSCRPADLSAPADVALPHPGVQRVLSCARLVARGPGGRASVARAPRCAPERTYRMLAQLFERYF